MILSIFHNHILGHIEAITEYDNSNFLIWEQII